MLSPKGQKYYQAAADWVRAKLRKESGATIPPDEMAQEIKTYFPIPGDYKETIRQKAAARKQAEAGMIGMAGRAIPGSGSGGSPRIVKRTGTHNGRKVVEYQDGSVEYAP